MLVKEINYKETSCFSPLFCDYMNNEPKLKSFNILQLIILKIKLTKKKEIIKTKIEKSYIM